MLTRHTPEQKITTTIKNKKNDNKLHLRCTPNEIQRDTPGVTTFNVNSAQREGLSHVVCRRKEAPTRQLHGIHPLLSLEMVTPENKSIHSKLSSNMQEKSDSQAVLSKDAAHPSCDLPKTPHGASRLVQAMSAWPVKTPEVLRPGIVGMPGSMVIRLLRPCMIMSTPPVSYTHLTLPTICSV